MIKKFVFDEEFNEDRDLDEIKFYSKHTEDFYLTEIDFYPPADNRFWTSNVEDVEDGDNFADYCEYIFKLYEEEGYYDN